MPAPVTSWPSWSPVVLVVRIRGPPLVPAFKTAPAVTVKTRAAFLAAQ